jgi:hypothetical protein
MRRPKLALAETGQCASGDGLGLCFGVIADQHRLGARVLIAKPMNHVDAEGVVKPVGEFAVQQDQIHTVLQQVVKLLLVIGEDNLGLGIGPGDGQTQIAGIGAAVAYQHDCFRRLSHQSVILGGCGRSGSEAFQ